MHNCDRPWWCHGRCLRLYGHAALPTREFTVIRGVYVLQSCVMSLLLQGDEVWANYFDGKSRPPCNADLLATYAMTPLPCIPTVLVLPTVKQHSTRDCVPAGGALLRGMHHTPAFHSRCRLTCIYREMTRTTLPQEWSLSIGWCGFPAGCLVFIRRL